MYVQGLSWIHQGITNEIKDNNNRRVKNVDCYIVCRHDDRFVLKRQKAEKCVVAVVSSAAPLWKVASLRLRLALDIVCRDSPFSKQQCGIVSISNLKKKKKPSAEPIEKNTFADGRPDTNTRRYHSGIFSITVDSFQKTTFLFFFLNRNRRIDRKRRESASQQTPIRLVTAITRNGNVYTTRSSIR